MAKEVAGLIKLQIKGGAANPSPPVGPALGSKGINIMEFCKQFNARTQDKAGKILREALFYPGVNVEVYQAHDDNTHQIKDIESLIERKVDLLIVAP